MPYRIDLFAIFIFLGIVQAVFLSFFFLSAENRKIQSNLFYGLLLISLAACLLEIFLMYTGYIVHCLYLVDFSEPMGLLLGPLFFLTVKSMIHGNVKKKDWYLHFSGPAVYTVLLIPFLLADNDVKFNSWVEAFDVNLPYRETRQATDPRIFWLTDHHTLLTLISLSVYALLCLYLMIVTFRRKRESFIAPENPVLLTLRSGALQIAGVTLIILVIKYFNPLDTGDHIFAAYISIIIYLISFRVMRQSGFFRQSTLHDPQRYKNSTLTEQQQQALLEKLNEKMKTEKPYLSANFSLPELAQQMGTGVHALSQAINEGLGKNFFEMTAEYRVEEAKKLLAEQRHIKVEEIAEQVGYSSKSSFNTAFKKITGMTPSAYRSSV